MRRPRKRAAGKVSPATFPLAPRLIRALLAESSAPGVAWSQVDGSTWKQRDRVALWSERSLLVQDK